MRIILKHLDPNVLRALAAAFLLILAGALPARAQDDAAFTAAVGRLEQTRAALDQIESTLSKPDLPDSLLQSIRQQIDPISATIQSVIAEASPRVDAIKTRLDQLGPKPGEKDAPESAAVTAERADQEKALAVAQELIKRARLSAVQAEQAAATIASRRRGMFTRALFERNVSPLQPSLWIAVAYEMPRQATALWSMLTEWGERAARILPGWRLHAFVAYVVAVFLLYWPLSRVARRVIWRDPEQQAPTRLRKALAALWVAVVVALLPIASTLAIVAASDIFGLTTQRIAPVLAALVEGVTAVSVTLGLARGLLATRRPTWRPIDVSTPVAQALYRMAIAVAAVFALTKVLEAINEAVVASLPFSVATRGLGALAVVAVMATSLWGVGKDGDDEECLGPPIAPRNEIGGALRFLAWLAIVFILGSAAIGYVALASFTVAQLVWVAGLGVTAFLLSVLIDEGAAAGFKPNAPIGRALMTSVGVRRDALERWGILTAGILRVALFLVVALLAMAPWGLQSDDLIGNLRAAFFGFKVGDVTISLSTIVSGIAIFGVVYAATRSIQRWLEQKYLPQTQLDAGLRNSIDTVVGYLGFLLAVALALAHVGLSFEKLAIVAGALSVGIGFGLQSIVSNFVSGLILLWERAVRVGDWIVVGDQQGYVRRINVRSTEIETFDRSTVIVPNSNLVSGVVKNWVRTDRVGRLKIPVAVEHSADPEQVRELLIAAAKGHELVMKFPAPSVMFVGMEASGLNFELLCFVQDIETGTRVKSDLNFDIFRRLKAATIAIATGAPPTVVAINGLDRLEALLKPEPGERSPA